MQNQKVRVVDVQEKDLMAFVQYVKVKSKEPTTDSFGRVRQGSTKIKVENPFTEEEFEIRGDDLIKTMYSADRFMSIKKVTITEIAKIFVRSWGKPFTVTFEKKNGETRNLRGYLVDHEELMGRSHVVDLDVESEHNLRQVDHRTISVLIVDGVKYIVK